MVLVQKNNRDDLSLMIIRWHFITSNGIYFGSATNDICQSQLTICAGSTYLCDIIRHTP